MGRVRTDVRCLRPINCFLLKFFIIAYKTNAGLNKPGKKHLKSVNIKSFAISLFFFVLFKNELNQVKLDKQLLVDQDIQNYNSFKNEINKLKHDNSEFKCIIEDQKVEIDKFKFESIGIKNQLVILEKAKQRLYFHQSVIKFEFANKIRNLIDTVNNFEDIRHKAKNDILTSESKTNRKSRSKEKVQIRLMAAPGKNGCDTIGCDGTGSTKCDKSGRIYRTHSMVSRCPNKPKVIENNGNLEISVTKVILLLHSNC